MDNAIAIIITEDQIDAAREAGYTHVVRHGFGGSHNLVLCLRRELDAKGVGGARTLLLELSKRPKPIPPANCERL